MALWCGLVLKRRLCIEQVLIESNSGEEGSALEREFFILRKLIEKEKTHRFEAEGADPSDFYICTLSTRIIVYKVKTASQQPQACFRFLALPALAVCMLSG
jgi:glutamate synthase domain-containing protein 1